MTTCLQRAVAACFILGGALTAATITPGTSQVTVSGTLALSQADTYFVYHFFDANGVGTTGVTLFPPVSVNPNCPAVTCAGILPGGVPLAGTYTLPSTVASGYGTLIGLYSAGLVTVGMASTSGANAIAGSQAFGTTFVGASESVLAAALVSGNTAALVAFLDTYKTLFPQFNGTGSAVTVSGVSFSNAAADGSLSVSILAGPAASATPEPSSFLLAAPVLLLLLRGKKRRAS